LCASLARSFDAARIEAATDGDLTALMVRFRTGAVANVSLRTASGADRFVLAAAGPGALVDARSVHGPLCVDGLATPSEESVHEAVAFVRAVAAGRAAPFPVDRALATMRL